jgi:hypothetical protein
MSKWQLPPKGGHTDKRNGVYLQTMTMRDIEERLQTNDVLIVPRGATEAHGPNAPIGEDVISLLRGGLDLHPSGGRSARGRRGCAGCLPTWRARGGRMARGTPA